MLQLRDLQKLHGSPPIFMAGDIFEKWNSSPRLISWAIQNFKELTGVHTIPGNHDLPHHNYKEMYRSAYWCLVEAGVADHLTPGMRHEIGELAVHGYPFSFELAPLGKDRHSLALNVALIHSYIWTKKTAHKDAAANQRYGTWLNRLEGFDVAVFGDNHKSFIMPAKVSTSWKGNSNPCTVLNCGSFLRRHSDEKDHKPSVGVLYNNGEMERHYLDTEQDNWIDTEEEVSKMPEGIQAHLARFAEQLSEMHSEKMDLARTTMLWLNKYPVPDEVRRLILKWIGE